MREHDEDRTKPWSVRVGVTDKEATERFRPFLREIPHFADIMHPPETDHRRWRFSTGEVRLHRQGWGYVIVHGVVEMFMWTPHLEVMMRMLVERDADDPLRTALYVAPTSYRESGGEIRWRRYGPHRGSDELLAYGNRRREDIAPGAVLLLTPDQRRAVLDAYAAQRAHLREKIADR